MKNKILVGIVVLILVGVGVWLYSNRDNKAVQETPEEGLLTTADFSILLPEGWQEADASTDFSVIAVNAAEEVTDAKAEAINFKTYFAVNYDTLQGTSLADYVPAFKAQITQMDQGAVFSNENKVTINNREVTAFEVDMTQEEIDFKVLVVLVKGDSDDLWIITFNTLEGNWNSYQELFAQVVNSFQLK
jgi:hypothetical protein